MNALAYPIRVETVEGIEVCNVADANGKVIAAGLSYEDASNIVRGTNNFAPALALVKGLGAFSVDAAKFIHYIEGGK